MKPTLRDAFSLVLILASVQFARPTLAQPQFAIPQPQTNREMLIQLTAPTGLTYRIEAAVDITNWYSLLTLQSTGTGVNRHTDSAAPYLSARYYRALEVATNEITGDHLTTTNGYVTIHPMYHATFMMTWNGKVIYNDPSAEAMYAATYNGLPKADLILVSHSHSDHFSSGKLEAIRGTNCVIIAPAAVYNDSSMTATLRSITTVLNYGVATNVFGLNVEAVPAYNTGYHPYGFNNAYVLTIGGKRILTTGDCGNGPELRALQNIDVAFVCMNIPYTMTVSEATNCVRAFRPAVVYPYHYRNLGNATTNATYFKQLMGSDTGIEVRLRKWY